MCLAVLLCVLKTDLHALHSNAEKAEENAVMLPVIMYHSVYTASPSEYAVTTPQLEQDLIWLKQHGYQSVPAELLIQYTQGTAALPEKPVLITLDDGFYNNYSELLPLLEQYDMYAIVSVVGAYTENQAESDAHNPNFSYLTWEEIRLLNASQRVAVGNHTYNMHSLQNGRIGCAKTDGESDEAYTEALSADIGLLQTKLHAHAGIEPFVFAYPFGSVSRESIPVLRDAGFLMTLTCRERPNRITRDPECLYGLGRYNRSGLESTEAFMQKLFS